MKTKLTLLMIMMSSLIQGQSLIYNLESNYITTSVEYDGARYLYLYWADSKIDNKDISNISIDMCFPEKVYDIYGNDPHKIEYMDHSIKFDNLNPKENEFIFGYYSPNAPEVNNAYIKASTTTYTTQVLSPACQIPEPSVLSLLFGLILFAPRRR